MCFRSLLVPLVVLLLPFQQQGDLFRRHYEAAEAHRRAGNIGAAEAEFKLILAEAYHRIGRVYSAQTDYPASVAALESANRFKPESPEIVVDLS
ncbi:MAG TPA: hypothetical protein VIB00_04955, partial [Pyrinomonadaceae bacterium]